MTSHETSSSPSVFLNKFLHASHHRFDGFAENEILSPHRIHLDGRRQSDVFVGGDVWTPLGVHLQIDHRHRREKPSRSKRVPHDRDRVAANIPSISIRPFRIFLTMAAQTQPPTTTCRQIPGEYRCLGFQGSLLQTSKGLSPLYTSHSHRESLFTIPEMETFARRKRALSRRRRLFPFFLSCLVQVWCYRRCFYYFRAKLDGLRHPMPSDLACSTNRNVWENTRPHRLQALEHNLTGHKRQVFLANQDEVQQKMPKTSAKPEWFPEHDKKSAQTRNVVIAFRLRLERRRLGDSSFSQEALHEDIVSGLGFVRWGHSSDSLFNSEAVGNTGSPRISTRFSTMVRARFSFRLNRFSRRRLRLKRFSRNCFCCFFVLFFNPPLFKFQPSMSSPCCCR